MCTQRQCRKRQGSSPHLAITVCNVFHVALFGIFETTQPRLILSSGANSSLSVCTTVVDHLQRRYNRRVRINIIARIQGQTLVHQIDKTPPRMHY